MRHSLKFTTVFPLVISLGCNIPVRSKLIATLSMLFYHELLNMELFVFIQPMLPEM
jgi:hypothetical protein